MSTSETKIFSKDTNMLLQRHRMSNIFGGLTYTMRGLCVSLNHQHTTLWMRHWLEIISVPFLKIALLNKKL